MIRPCPKSNLPPARRRPCAHASHRAQGLVVRDLKAGGADKEAIGAAVQKLLALKEAARATEVDEWDAMVLALLEAIPSRFWIGAVGGARARRQLAGLHAFLRCAGVPGLTAQPSPGVLEQAVLASATHTRDTASYQSQLSPSVRCLWERLRNGSALRHHPPCIVGGASVERLGTV